MASHNDLTPSTSSEAQGSPTQRRMRQFASAVGFKLHFVDEAIRFLYKLEHVATCEYTIIDFEETLAAYASTHPAYKEARAEWDFNLGRQVKPVPTKTLSGIKVVASFDSTLRASGLKEVLNQLGIPAVVFRSQVKKILPPPKAEVLISVADAEAHSIVIAKVLADY